MSAIIADVEQGSEEWLALRRLHITATDAGIITRGNPFRSIESLYEEKTNPDYRQPYVNENMQRGIDLEPSARRLFEIESGISLTPKVFVKGWQMASLDGISEDGKIVVEIKCPGEKGHKMAQSGVIPAHYRAQLQHIINLLDLDWLYYYSFFDGKGVSIRECRSQKFIDEMNELELEFYECVQSRTPPIIYREKEDRRWREVAIEYKEVKNEIKKLEDREKALRAEICLMSGGDNCRGAGIKVRQCERIGNVDYKRLVSELVGVVDVEPYRSPPVKYCKIT